jgi:hypothetical protein
MLFVGDDWAEDHHDVEVIGEDGRRLAARRVPDGPGGIAALHALIARFVPQDWAELDPVTAATRVKVGIETDRGPWVAALVAAGYEVFAINRMSVSRYRDDHIVARNQAYNGRSMSRACRCWPRSRLPATRSMSVTIRPVGQSAGEVPWTSSAVSSGRAIVGPMTASSRRPYGSAATATVQPRSHDV